MAIKKAKVSDLINILQEQVSNHSIYVWSAAGQLCKNINEKWIREREARNNGGSHADDAVAAWKEVMQSPYKSVARAFDCSGYVSWCLIQLKALDKRRDCDGLYSMCTPITLSDRPKDGTFLFRVNKDDHNDETHIGVYCSGYQFHAKGRKDKVVREKFKKSYWYKAGWYKYLEEEKPSPQPEPTPTPTPTPTGYVFTRLLKYGCVGDDVIELKKLLIAHGYDTGISVNKKYSNRFASATRKMVKQYQKDNGLVVDGIAGKNTITSLGGIWQG